MLVIMLSILKWIGIILCSLFGLLLVAVICVLFVPVRYRINICLGDQRQLTGKISWLLHLIHVSFCVSEGGTDYKIRIVGIPLTFPKARKTKRKKKKEKKTSRRAASQPEKAIQQPSDVSKPLREERQQSPSDTEGLSRADRTETPAGTDGAQEEIYGPERQQPRRSILDRGRYFLRRIRDFFLSIGAIFVKIKQGVQRVFFEKRMSDDAERGTIAKIIQLLRDENTPELLGLLRDNLGFLWRHTCPTKAKGWVHFGTEDPCTTGQLLGAISIFFAIWGNAITVIPDFEQSVLEGEVELKGRLHFIVLLIILIKLLSSRQWRHFRKQWDAIGL